MVRRLGREGGQKNVEEAGPREAPEHHGATAESVETGRAVDGGEEREDWVDGVDEELCVFVGYAGCFDHFGLLEVG